MGMRVRFTALLAASILVVVGCQAAEVTAASGKATTIVEGTRIRVVSGVGVDTLPLDACVEVAAIFTMM